MPEFRMPSLGADMEFGIVLQWLVKPGDAVRRGDIVAVVDTSKAEIDVEIFEDGVIEELLVAEGTRVPVGTVLATLRTGASGPPPAPGERPLPEAPPPLQPAPAAASRPTQIAVPAGPPHRRQASPVARRAAEQLDVDLDTVTGSGPDGAIIKADVERVAAASGRSPAATPPPPSPPQPPVAAPSALPGPAVDLLSDRQAAMRQAIGALMARSKREIPHYYLENQIDMSASLDWLREENLSRSVTTRLLPSVLLLHAVALAVAATPTFNGFWLDDAFHQADGVHLGIAISLRGGGLIAPALHDADRMTLDELMAGLRDLVQRARTGRLRSSEMSDPTITVTNLGDQGVDLVHGVIYPPQVALIGFGAIRERPWARDGMIGARPVVRASLAADHRASDGHAGGRLLALIDRQLQQPEAR